MPGKAVISLTTGLEDPEKVTSRSWSRSAVPKATARR